MNDLAQRGGVINIGVPKYYSPIHVFTEEDVKYILKIMSLEPGSLDAQVNKADDQDDTFLGDFVADPGPSPMDIAAENERHETLMKFIKRLSPREQVVICKRFGLEDDIVHSLEEVGQEYGLTRERIRQVEQKAIRKLKAMMHVKGITSIDNF